MGDHTVYKAPEGETTQWEDIQVKLGNREARPKPETLPQWEPEQDSRLDKHHIDSRTADELEDLEDELADDQYLEQYRQQRLAELKQAAQAPRFGGVEKIGASEFVAQVTNAGESVWVVVHLYKDKVAACTRVAECLTELAQQFPATKFLRIISTDCIPNYPDENLPTLLVYNDTRCVAHLAGQARLGGPRLTPDQLAFALNRHGPVCRREGDEEKPTITTDDVRKFMERFILQHQQGQHSTKQEDSEE